MKQQHVTLAPGERADLVVDFAASAGRSVVLGSQASPLMQFRVAKGPVARSPSVPATLRPLAVVRTLYQALATPVMVYAIALGAWGTAERWARSARPRDEPATTLEDGVEPASQPRRVGALGGAFDGGRVGGSDCAPAKLPSA